jgi:hypothetical protein
MMTNRTRLELSDYGSGRLEIEPDGGQLKVTITEPDGTMAQFLLDSAEQLEIVKYILKG